MIGKHKIIAIVAVDNNWAIGKNNQLLYNIPSDMKFFRETTKNNIVVYGYNTLQSFPNAKPLPYRQNIVLTSKKFYTSENLVIVHNINDMIKTIKNIDTEQNVFICGGQSVYGQLLTICDEAYVTKVDAITDNADAFFPNLDNLKKWELKTFVSKTDEKSNLTVKFCKYKQNGSD